MLRLGSSLQRGSSEYNQLEPQGLTTRCCGMHTQGMRLLPLLIQRKLSSLLRMAPSSKADTASGSLNTVWQVAAKLPGPHLRAAARAPHPVWRPPASQPSRMPSAH